MNPHSTPTNDLDDLDRLLQRGAKALRDEPAPDLRARILAALPDTPREPDAAPVLRPVPRSMSRGWLPLAAAAAVLALAGGAFWWSRASVEPTPAGHLDKARLVVATRELFGAGAQVRRLPTLAADNLRDEAEYLLADATRAAERIVGGLARPLRDPLAR